MDGMIRVALCGTNRFDIQNPCQKHSLPEALLFRTVEANDNRLTHQLTRTAHL
jgi:hypothetical protein